MPKDKDQDTRPAQSRYSLKSRVAIEASHPHVPPVSWCYRCQQEAEKRQKVPA